MSLDVSWCPRITDAALEYIACDLTHLEELTLDRLVVLKNIEEITLDNFHISLIQVCPHKWHRGGVHFHHAGSLLPLLEVTLFITNWLFAQITSNPHFSNGPFSSLAGGALRSGTLAFSTFVGWETFTYYQWQVFVYLCFRTQKHKHLCINTTRITIKLQKIQMF